MKKLITVEELRQNVGREVSLKIPMIGRDTTAIIRNGEFTTCIGSIVKEKGIHLEYTEPTSEGTTFFSDVKPLDLLDMEIYIKESKFAPRTLVRLTSPELIELSGFDYGIGEVIDTVDSVNDTTMYRVDFGKPNGNGKEYFYVPEELLENAEVAEKDLQEHSRVVVYPFKNSNVYRIGTVFNCDSIVEDADGYNINLNHYDGKAIVYDEAHGGCTYLAPVEDGITRVALLKKEGITLDNLDEFLNEEVVLHLPSRDVKGVLIKGSFIDCTGEYIDTDDMNKFMNSIGDIPIPGNYSIMFDELTDDHSTYYGLLEECEIEHMEVI